MNSSASIIVEEVIIEQVVVSSTRGYWQGSHYISRGRTGHWSKWGGPRKDLIQEEVTNTWYCQSCRKEQKKEFMVYQFEFPLGGKEYIRVCHDCMMSGCPQLLGRVNSSDFRW